MRKAIVALVVVCALVGVVSGPAGAVNRARVRKPGPLRVLLVGDSVTLNYENVAAAALEAKGYQVTRAGWAGSGLLDQIECSGDYARQLLYLADPDVVIFENTGNYALLTGAGVMPCAPQVAYNSKAFYKQWKQSARVNQKILISRGARFSWVLVPAGPPGVLHAVIPQLNKIYRSFASKKIGLVDAYAAFGGESYTPALHSDGVHLSPAGVQKMANLVVASVG